MIKMPKDWEKERHYLENSLYDTICKVLEEYETPGYNSHQRTQAIVKEAVERCESWIKMQYKPEPTPEPTSGRPLDTRKGNKC